MPLTHDDLPVSDVSALDRPVPDGPAPFPLPPAPRRHRRGTGSRRTLQRRAPLRRDPRRRDLRRRGAAARTRPHRRHPTPTVGWRLSVATAGALLLVLVSGMALGIVTVSPSGLGLHLRDTSAGPRLVTGADGVYPGGDPRSVSLTVRNTAGSAFEIAEVSADLHDLPEECPAAAWRIEAPGILPTVPARSEVTVPLPVTLTADAPDSCQGMTVRFPVILDGLRHPLPAATAEATAATAGHPAGETSPGATAGLRPERLESAATVTVARLGTPGGTLSVHEGRVGVLPSPAAGGPVPTTYDVEVAAGPDRRATVCAAVAGLCVDQGSPAAASRQYVVTARMGVHWRRQSAALQAWTPPPAPSLQFGDGGGAPSSLVLAAPPGATGYDVAVYADGAAAPFHTARTVADTALREVVGVPHLTPGTHRFVAVARFHGWRAPSGALRLTVSDGGVSTGPSEAPAPVTSDPAHPPLTTSGPPVPVVPTAAPSSAGPTRTTRTTPRSGTAQAPGADGPPQATLPDAPGTSAPSGHDAPGPVVPVVPTAMATAAREPAAIPATVPIPTLPN